MIRAMERAVWAIALASTGFMTGLIWFVQVVHYPLLAEIPASTFQQYEAEHIRLTGWVVVPPMLLEAAASLALLRCRPVWLRLPIVWLGIALLVINSLVTALVMAPGHDELLETGDQALVAGMVSWNWLRTVLWSLRFVVLLLPFVLIRGDHLSNPSSRLDSGP